MNHDEYIRRIKLMNPIDDDFFKKMAEDVAFCEETIQTVMEDDTIKIIDLKPQNYIKNLQGRSVVLDMLCESEKKGCFCVEIQKANDDDHQRRVRYNSSCVTTNITDPGSRFEDVPDLCSIYISKSDIFKGERTIYHVERRVRETGEVLDNGFQEIYVNAQVKDDSSVSELMTIYTKGDAYDYEKFPATSKRKHQFKEEEEGVNEMCDIVQDIVQDIMQEVRQEERQEGAKVLIETCREFNCPYEDAKRRVVEKLALDSEAVDKLMEKYWTA